MHITSDVIEYEDIDDASETMQILGIVLDFKTKMMTIDEIILPMRQLKNLQSQNSLTTIYGHTEPIATPHERKCMVKIVDAKYEKADLPKVVSENCAHLNTTLALLFTSVYNLLYPT